jgi:hypothetical protein
MSEIMTDIGLPGAGGIMEYGRKTRAEMVALFREKAAHDKADAERVLAAADDEFKVRVVRGIHVQHLIERL